MKRHVPYSLWCLGGVFSATLGEEESSQEGMGASQRGTTLVSNHCHTRITSVPLPLILQLNSAEGVGHTLQHGLLHLVSLYECCNLWYEKNCDLLLSPAIINFSSTKVLAVYMAQAKPKTVWHKRVWGDGTVRKAIRRFCNSHRAHGDSRMWPVLLPRAKGDKARVFWKLWRALLLLCGKGYTWHFLRNKTQILSFVGSSNGHGQHWGRKIGSATHKLGWMSSKWYSKTG